MIKSMNAADYELSAPVDLVGASAAANKIAYQQVVSAGNSDLTVIMSFTTPASTSNLRDCSRCMRIPGPNGHYGNRNNVVGYSQETGTLFTTEYWDDESYEILPNNVDISPVSTSSVTTATFGHQTMYVSNIQETVNSMNGCEISQCTIMHYDRDTRTCTTNYTNVMYAGADWAIMMD